MTENQQRPVKWYNRDWEDYNNIKNNKTNIKSIKETLEDSVKRQLMSDVPYGVLLSGGLDSSITSALAKEIFQKKELNLIIKKTLGVPVTFFSIGLVGSPDLAAAKIAAKKLGTIHHEVTFTIQEGLDAINDVIYHLGT